MVGAVTCGDPLTGIEETIHQAIAATAWAEAQLEALDDHEQAASVGQAVAAARFDLEESLQRLTRP